MQTLMAFLGTETRVELIWVLVGLAGQIMFMMRFLIQWFVSEKAKKSVIPVSFWWFSIAGAAILLAYAIWRQDPVFILGQSLGFFIYARNLWLIRAETRGPG
ncbi:MAG: lipid-A-disaccharide synthase N-terminal domain-containing protein [Pseudomonadota bacterium]